MYFRKANTLDLDDLVIIIEQAKKFLKENEVDQWQDGYPCKEDLEKDILNEISYVLVENEKIIGTTSVAFDGETTYDNIYDGKWMTDDKYVVMHRVAIHNSSRGVGIFSLLLKEVEKLAVKENIFSIKIDTHKKNIPMQKTLMKNGFKMCGIIYLDDGKKRIAFEKNIKNI